MPMFPDFICRAIIRASDYIQEYRAVQKRADLIEISLKIPAELQRAIQQKVHQSLLDLLARSHCQIPNIYYQEYKERTEHHKKLRRIEREFNPDAK